MPPRQSRTFYKTKEKGDFSERKEITRTKDDGDLGTIKEDAKR